MNVTQTALKKLQPKEKRYEVNIGEGLTLDVLTSGKKIYRFRADKKKIKIGDFDLMTLEKAKEIRDRYRVQMLDCPEYFDTSAHTLQSVFDEWIKTKKGVTPKTDYNLRQRSGYLLRALGNRPINKISSRELLEVAKAQEEQGKIDLAHRLIQIAGQIFRYAVIQEYCKYDITPPLFGALTPKHTEHYATITEPKEAARFLCDIETKINSHIMKAMIKLHILFFCRPGELRQAKWTEFDGDLWRIPAERMKMRREHLVPLSRQAQDIMKELHQLTGYSQYVFPSPQFRDQPMSDNAENNALHRMGTYNIRAHGFRAMAATLLREKGYSSEIIEKQLSHEVGNSVSRAYNHAEYLEQRKAMMQDWADYIDTLKNPLP